MSYYKAGFPSAFATEADPFKAFDPYIHVCFCRLGPVSLVLVD